jgi:hypothetical protein
MIGVDNFAGLGVSVTGLVGLGGLLELAIEAAEQDAGIANVLARIAKITLLHEQLAAPSEKCRATWPIDRLFQSCRRPLGKVRSPPRAMRRKVSDEFTVSLCRTRHRDIHNLGLVG